MTALKQPITPNQFAYYDNHNAPTPSQFLDWVQLLELVENPTIAPAKSGLSAITATDAPAKKKEAVLSHNRFTLLWIDLDEWNLEKAEIANILERLGFESFVIHSTFSATPTAKKWRVLIEINPPLSLDDWQVIQIALSRVFGGDEAATRPQQIMYLPAVQSETAFYDYHIEHGNPWGIHSMSDELQSKIDEVRAEQQSQAVPVDDLLEQAKNAPQAVHNLPAGEMGIIDQVNQAYDLVQVLQTYGYTKQGNKWKHPQSKSGLAGVVLLDGRYYSHHSSDPLNDGYTHDTFDLLCFWRFSNNIQEAVKTLANELDQEGQKARQRDYMETKDKTNLVAIDGLLNQTNETLPPPIKTNPDPLMSAKRIDNPYPLELLPDTLKGAVMALHEGVQAPLPLCGQAVLMAVNLYAQGLKNVVIDGRTIPLTLFSLIIAESSERKSSVDKLVMRPIKHYQSNLKAQYDEDYQTFLKEQTAYREAEKQIKKSIPKDLAETEVKEWVGEKLENLGAPPKAPLVPTLTSKDLTLEGMIKHLRTALPVLGIFTAEGGGFFGGHSLTQDKAKYTITKLSEAWDGEPFEMLRADADTGFIYLENRRVSIGLMAQEIAVKDVLNNPLMVGQGFIPRFLICNPPTNVGNRPYNGVDVTEDKRFKRYHAQLLERLEQGLNIREDGSLDLLPLAVDGLAKDAYIELYNEVEARQLDDLAHIRGTAGKIAEQALRIAGTLAVFEQGKQTQFISQSVMGAGIALARYSLNELLNLYEASVIPQAVKDAIKLLEWCKDKDHVMIYSTLISAKAPNQLRKKERYEPALVELVDKGYLQRLENIEVEGKHRKEAFRVLHNEPV